MCEFVNFSIAKKLKEKGFDKYCSRAYSEIGCFNDTDTYKSSEEFYCYAPTISQVLKWLREEKKIFIDIRTSIDLNGKEHFSYYIIHNKVSIREGYTDFDWKFEQAAIAGIEYVIDNLI